MLLGGTSCLAQTRQKVLQLRHIRAFSTGLSARWNINCNLRAKIRSHTANRPRAHGSHFSYCTPALSTRMSSSQPATSFRLPTNVKPSHYDLTIVTDLDTLSFEGVVTVKYSPHIPPHRFSSQINHSLDVKEDSSTIVLNTDDLQIGAAFVVDLGSPFNILKTRQIPHIFWKNTGAIQPKFRCVPKAHDVRTV